MLSLVPCLTTEIRVINTKNGLCDSKTKPKTESTKHSSLHELMNHFGIALGKNLCHVQMKWDCFTNKNVDKLLKNQVWKDAYAKC